MLRVWGEKYKNGQLLGWTSTTVAVYIAECSPPDLRGRLIALQSCLITLGRFSGALVSAIVFSAQPPVTGHKRPVLAAALKSKQGARVLQWLDVLDFTGRRSFSSPRFGMPVIFSFFSSSLLSCSITSTSLSSIVVLFLFCCPSFLCLLFYYYFSNFWFYATL